jgi:hypothetical protein
MAEKKYKPHMMYCKNGKSFNAKTYKEQGCGHKKPK